MPNTQPEQDFWANWNFLTWLLTSWLGGKIGEVWNWVNYIGRLG